MYVLLHCACCSSAYFILLQLAVVYRMDTQMVDQEPHRSVQLFKRVDTRIPSPLLSSSVAQSAMSSTSLGKLADLRAPVAQLPRPQAGLGRSLAPTPPPSAPAGARGWTSVVARPSSAQASAAPSPTAWLMGDSDRASSTSVAPPTRPRAAPTPVSAPVPSAPQASAADVPESWEDEA